MSSQDLEPDRGKPGLGWVAKLGNKAKQKAVLQPKVQKGNRRGMEAVCCNSQSTEQAKVGRYYSLTFLARPFELPRFSSAPVHNVAGQPQEALYETHSCDCCRRCRGQLQLT